MGSQNPDSKHHSQFRSFIENTVHMFLNHVNSVQRMLSGSALPIYLRLASNSTVEPPEGNTLLLLDDVIQEAHCFAQMHALDYSSCLTSVLSRDK